MRTHTGHTSDHGSGTRLYNGTTEMDGYASGFKKLTK